MIKAIWLLSFCTAVGCETMGQARTPLLQSSQLQVEAAELCEKEGQYESAFEWYVIAATRFNNADAAFNLANMASRGAGIKLNDPMAMAAEFYRKAADLGNAKAPFHLGVLYHTGKGLSQSFREAENWYRKGASLGDASAQFALGVMLTSPSGRPLVPVEGAKWFLAAAEQGHHPSQFELAKLLESGIVVPRDLIQAHKWFNLAAASGDPNAIARRNALSKRLLPAQLEKAQELASQWKPGEPKIR